LSPLEALRVNEGAALYVCHVAPVKLADSEAMYCVGVFVQVLFSVTVLVVVLAAPLLMLKLDTTGGRIMVIVSLAALEAPASFWTLK
jgi:hypothetical protein